MQHPLYLFGQIILRQNGVLMAGSESCVDGMAIAF
jgi:hypothetical protein